MFFFQWRSETSQLQERRVSGRAEGGGEEEEERLGGGGGGGGWGQAGRGLPAGPQGREQLGRQPGGVHRQEAAHQEERGGRPGPLQHLP